MEKFEELSQEKQRRIIDAGMEVFYFCADPHNKPIVHPKVTTFTHLSQLPELWKARGWDITA